MTTNSIKFMAMAACVALSFVSCQNDNDDDSSLFFLTPEFHTATMIQTRATISGDATSSNYERISAQEGDQVHAFTYDAGHTPKYDAIRSGYFTYSGGKWKSTVGCEQPHHDIDIYSIMPSDIASATMTENGVVTLSSLNVLSKKDVLYSVAAAKTEAELEKGNFHLTDVKLATKEGDEEDKVWFAMDHLFAKVRLKFQCDTNYRELRTIEITKVTVSTEMGICTESSIYFPQDSIVFGNPTNSHQDFDMTLPPASSPAGLVELTISPQDFDSLYVLPKDGIPVTVKVDYNIFNNYDNPNDTVRTRGGQTASANNIIVPGDLQAGKEYDITVTVKPTYLYVLADVDGKLELTIE